MDEAFQKQLLELFVQEAGEHLELLTSGTVELEQASPARRKELVETLFREAHSLKGAARSAGDQEMERLARETEALFAVLKEQELSPGKATVDLLLETFDYTAALLPRDEQGRKET